MTVQQASIILQDLPIPTENNKHSPEEYQQAKAMAINAMVRTAAVEYMLSTQIQTPQHIVKRSCMDCIHFRVAPENGGKCTKNPSVMSTPEKEQCTNWAEK